ncbi:MAG: porin [Rhodocyclales bacterium]|nr:porin [Rhodocyclales bacterium]
MQKKLIALAIAGLSSVAFAQSNVTISGQMKVGVDNVRAGGATAANSDYTSRTRVVDNNSNIRFSGEEALGNGTSAWFQIESAIGTDNYAGTAAGGSNTNGASVTVLGARDTAVGLKGNWGTALFGKWSVHYQSMVNVETAGLADGLALVTSSLNLLNTINGTSELGSTRLSNAMAYATPVVNGFQGQIAYTTLGEATTPLLNKKDNGWNLKGTYNNGPWAATYSYLAVNGAGAAAPTAAGGGTVNCSATATGAITVAASAAACVAGGAGVVVSTNAATAATTGNGSDVRSNRLGGAYTFPMGLKVGLIWDKSKNTNKTAAVDTTRERTAWALPVSYMTGAHKVSFTYAKAGKVSAESGAAAAVTDSTDSRMLMLGYQYNLSKRTNVSLAYTQINNNTNAVYDFWHPSSNVGGGGGVVNAGTDPRALSFNMMHSF